MRTWLFKHQLMLAVAAEAHCLLSAAANGRCSTSETRWCTSLRQNSAATTTLRASTAPRRRYASSHTMPFTCDAAQLCASRACLGCALDETCVAAGRPSFRSATGTRGHRMGDASLIRSSSGPCCCEEGVCDHIVRFTCNSEVAAGFKCMPIGLQHMNTLNTSGACCDTELAMTD